MTMTSLMIKNNQHKKYTKLSEPNLLNSKKDFFRDLQRPVYFLYIGNLIITIPVDN